MFAANTPANESSSSFAPSSPHRHDFAACNPGVGRLVGQPSIHLHEHSSKVLEIPSIPNRLVRHASHDYARVVGIRARCINASRGERSDDRSHIEPE
jgi:hypothetical protein